MTLELFALSNATQNTPASNDSRVENWPQYDHSLHGKTPNHSNEHTTADHFIIRNGVEFAGTHLIIDLIGASRLNDLSLMESTLRKAVDEAGATLLHIHLHHFTPNGGISGVAVLAESHISVHTWPERDFAAFDVFMCGNATPNAAIPILEAAFQPTSMSVTEHLRGVSVHHSVHDGDDNVGPLQVDR